jgi:uncharacterized C2H2 Zn-finger protein
MLIRHLENRYSCKPLKSHIVREILLEKLRNAKKKCPCPFCNKSYDHERSLMRHITECEFAPAVEGIACDGCGKTFRSEKGLDRHLNWCERADEIDLVKRLEMKMERKINEKMQLLALVAAPTTIPTQASSQTLGTGSQTNFNISGVANTGIAITNNIAPWDPLNVDFARLKAVDDRFVPPSSIMDRSLLSAHPTETLMKDHMQLDPPNHHSVLVKDAALGWDGVRFFDGVAYRRVADPKKEMDTRYQLCAREQLTHLEQNVAKVIELCSWQETITLETQRERLHKAPLKDTRFDILLRDVTTRSEELVKMARERQIAID